MIREYWSTREPREKGLLLIAGSLTFVIVLWFGVIAPLMAARADAKADLTRALGDQQLVVRGLASLGGGGASSLGPADDIDGFRATVTRMAQQRGLAISRLQGGSNGTLQLVFSDVTPAEIYIWIDEVSRLPGGNVIRANMTSRDDSVQAVIELQGTRP